ncbi:MAG TPA: rhomboid family intramembrane serine protease [Planctomycetota bacterium]|nr:rhomboid family intramembrane serine protease [Planctomycetota bacterium]
MDDADRRRIYINRVVDRLAGTLGFHPVAVAAPELAPFDDLAPHVLVRRHPDGYRQMIIPVACDSPDEVETHRQRIVDCAAGHPELARETRLRVFCVGVGTDAMSRPRRRRLLKPVRMLDDTVVVRTFWLSLDRRRLFACYSPWGFAPGFEINPCDPDDNVFVALARKDRYLTEPPASGLNEEFHRRAIARERTFLSGLGRHSPLVWTLLAVNVLAWLVLEFTGGSQNPAQLIRAGAKSDGLIRAGQTWRLVTPIFLHYGLFHLVLNSVALIVLGEVIERLYGTRQFALLYFVSGIVSVVASYFFGGELMVGASGAIFALAGALIVYGWRYRRRIPVRYRAMFGGGLVPLVIINVLFGIFIPGIDNSAHVGGLLTGLLLALALRPLSDEVTGPSRFAVRHLLALTVTGLAAGALLVGGVYFVQYPSIYRTDARWMTSVEIPGALTLNVPASWPLDRRGPDYAAWRSPCYPGRVDARALVTRDTPADALAAEFVRFAKMGFVADPPGLAFHYTGLVTGGRYEVRLTRRDGMERTQVFLWLRKSHVLVSVGVEIPEALKLAFVDVQERILAPLPLFKPAK